MKLALLRAIALITPARIASGATPAERRLIASDSANTVHILVMACGVTFSVMLSSCSTLGQACARSPPGNARCPPRICHSSGNRTGYRHHQAESLCCPDHRCRLPRALLAQETVRPARDRRFPLPVYRQNPPVPPVAGERQKRRCL